MHRKKDGDPVVADWQGAGEIRRDATFVVAKGIARVVIVWGNGVSPPYEDHLAERGRVRFAGYLEGNALRRSLAARSFDDQDFESVFAGRQNEVTLQRDGLSALGARLVEGDALRSVGTEVRGNSASLVFDVGDHRQVHERSGRVCVFLNIEV